MKPNATEQNLSSLIKHEVCEVQGLSNVNLDVLYKQVYLYSI